MKTLLLFLLLFISMSASSSVYAAAYDQTISPDQWCYRPFTCTFSFSGAVEPGGAGTLSVVGLGDINSPAEFAYVYDESGNFIDYSWDFDCAEYTASCEDSMTVSYQSLTASWSDGVISFDFFVPADNGLCCVIFQSLRLTYSEVSPSPVPLPGSLGLLATGVFVLGLTKRRRDPHQ